MPRRETLTYQITSAPQGSRNKESAVAVLFTETHGRWFFEPHANHASKGAAELAAVARAERHAKEAGYVAR